MMRGAQIYVHKTPKAIRRHRFSRFARQAAGAAQVRRGLVVDAEMR